MPFTPKEISRNAPGIMPLETTPTESASAGTPQVELRGPQLVLFLSLAAVILVLAVSAMLVRARVRRSEKHPRLVSR